jgi:hypothetical protein
MIDKASSFGVTEETTKEIWRVIIQFHEQVRTFFCRSADCEVP